LALIVFANMDHYPRKVCLRNHFLYEDVARARLHAAMFLPFSIMIIVILFARQDSVEASSSTNSQANRKTHFASTVSLHSDVFS